VQSFGGGLAEDLSFTRAAKRLKLSQSGLSRRLNELKSRCGCTLFSRDHANVAITEAGRAFVEEARFSIVHSERAMQAAKTAHAGVVSHLTIGHSPYVDPVLTSTLFSIRLPLHPNLLLNMQSDFAPELVHGVLTSKLDLALIANPGANRKLTTTKIAEAPFYVAIPDDHPLAARETLTLEDMHGCTWIIFDSEGSSHSARHDFSPRSRGWRHFQKHSECADGRRSPPIGFGKCWHRIFNDDERTANQKPRRNRSHFGR